MADVKDKIPTLEQLKLVKDSMSTPDIATTGAAGIVKPDGATITVDPDGTIKAVGGGGGGVTYSADEASLHLSGTQFSVKDGGITAGKIADGVIPDVSGFITGTAADKKYQPKGEYAASSHAHAAASSSAAGFAPQLSGNARQYLDGSGKWSTPPDTNTTYSPFKAATSGAAGGQGLVPAPAAGAQAKYLRGDGTWQTPPNTTYNVATQSANGLMSAADKKKLDGLAAPAVDIVCVTEHSTSYSKDTLEIVVDSSGRVTSMYFVKA